MTQSDQSLQQLTLALALGISTVIALLIPASYFLLSYQSLQSTLESQTELTATAVNSIIRSDQKMWRYEEVRLSELLERVPHDEAQQFLRILSDDGDIVAKNNVIIAPPVAMHTLNIFDAGTVVGRIEASRSLRPLLLNTTLIAFCSSLIGVIIFILFRRLPLNAINKAFQTLADSEKKYRSLYQTMKEGMALHRVDLDENGTFSSLTVIDANPSCAAMFDGNLDKIIGSDSFALFGGTFRDFFSEMPEIFEHGGSISFEICLPGKDYYYNVQTFSPDHGLIATLFEDITESRKAEQQIQEMAYFDTLTKLPNRALFHDRINQAIALAKRDNTSLAVLFIDLDHFKNVNDTLGHSAGDLLLIEASHRLSNHIRTSDTLARLGGDEFVVVISRLGEQLNATYVAQKLIDSIQTPFHIKGNELHISASIGIALFPDDGSNAETLIKHADMAMYFSKESGRNSYNFFSPLMNQKALQRMENEAGLRLALQRGEFFIELQPIMSANSRAIVAAEALVRWNHPTRGRIPPLEFISLAEETGLILPLGEWVLRTVCKTMKTLNGAGLPPIRYCVNVSSIQIEKQDFPEIVRTVLSETGANAKQLEIELTESCLVTGIDTNISDVFGMKEWGITIAIDDFGTGYSSLSYIKTLPIDHIKIDRAFVSNICTNVQDQAIVEAIITMSQKLGIKNIAEGVENKEQLEFLNRLGCCEIQGYYFHRPLPVDAFESLLRAQEETQ
jgi:diguanylate cyclase (GGDEF)-like protein